MEKLIKKTSSLGFTETAISTVTTGIDKDPFSIDDLIAAKKLMNETIAESYKELSDWMKKEGFDPEKGGRLILPKDMADILLYLPDFISASVLVEHPTLVYVPEPIIRISSENKTKLYEAICEPITRHRIAVAQSENVLGKKNARDIDDKLRQLEINIWKEVTTVLNIPEP